MVRQGRVFIRIQGFVTALGLLLLGWALWKANSLKSWPAVEAEVTKSEVSGPSSHSSSGTLVAPGLTGSHKTVYSTKVEFRFAAAGKQFTASSSDESDDRGGANQTARGFVPGTRHTIRYNPANPNEIRFNAGYFNVVYTVMFFENPIFFGLLGLVLAGNGLRLLWKSRSMRS
jgi:Protein of unknown function (DUF3592)